MGSLVSCSRERMKMTTSAPLNIRPSVQILNTFRTQGYKEWWAIAEFVDNSISSYVLNREKLLASEGAKYRLTITITLDAFAKRILIEDNAAGIFEKDMARAFEAGTPPPNKASLSQFGLGLKAAGIWFGNNIVVKTSALGEPYTKRIEIDLPEINRTNSEDVFPTRNPADPRTHGTIVILTNLARDVPSRKDSVDTIAEYLSSIYRIFLRKGEIEIRVVTIGSNKQISERKLTFENPNFLKAPRWDDLESSPVQWKKEIQFRMRNGKNVTGWAGLRDTGSYSNTGLVLTWNGKVIIGAGATRDVRGGNTAYKPYEIFKNANSAASLRLFGELDMSEFETTTRKDDLNWGASEEREFLESLHHYLEASPLPLVTMAYKYRAVESSQDVMEAWKAETANVGRAIVEVLEDPSAMLQIDTPTVEVARRLQEIEKSSEEWVAEYLYAPDESTSNTIRIGFVTRENDITFIVRQNPGEPSIREVLLNRASKFALSHIDPRLTNLGPIYRIFAALAIAEIHVRQVSGQPLVGELRREINAVLDSSAMTRIEVER